MFHGAKVLTPIGLIPIPATCPDGVTADFDGDGDVDLNDYAEFAVHFTGPR